MLAPHSELILKLLPPNPYFIISVSNFRFIAALSSSVSCSTSTFFPSLSTAYFNAFTRGFHSSSTSSFKPAIVVLNNLLSISVVDDLGLEDLDSLGCFSLGFNDLEGLDRLDGLEGGFFAVRQVWEGARSVTVSAIDCAISTQRTRTERRVTVSDWFEGGMMDVIVG